MSEMRWLRRRWVFYPSAVISMSELRWLLLLLVLSMASVPSAFEFRASQLPLRHVSVMAEALYTFEQKEEILLIGARWLRQPSVLSAASVLSTFEFRASRPPLLLASATECLSMFVSRVVLFGGRRFRWRCYIRLSGWKTFSCLRRKLLLCSHPWAFFVV